MENNKWLPEHSKLQSALLQRLIGGSCLMLNRGKRGVPVFTLDGEKQRAITPMALIRENRLIEMNSIWVLVSVNDLLESTEKHFISFWFSPPSSQMIMGLEGKLFTLNECKQMSAGSTIQKGLWKYMIREVKEGIVIH